LPVLGTDAAPARVALLGTGTVGQAVLARLAGWTGTALGARLQLVHVANSRVALQPAAAGWRRAADGGLGQRRVEDVLRLLAATPAPGDRLSADAHALGMQVRPLAAHQHGFDVARDALGDHGHRIVIDATASEAVAERHSAWLAQGIHVVTACKLGQGASLARWRAIQAACVLGGTQYGDSATVGAGLPLLRTIRELQAGGDRVHAIAGVLSGSLAWLFDHYDGLRPFSGFVREARDAGYTEPDPRDDLSGEDVRRKILILARAAGVALESGDVDVGSLVPPDLASQCPNGVDGALSALDAPLRERYAAAWKQGGKLRFIARLDGVSEGQRRARVGLESLPAGHPLAGGAGTDNRVAIWSDRYPGQPLLIQGPGAGAGVTAAALLDDALRIADDRMQRQLAAIVQPEAARSMA
jgi:homoserine dehydrogenase